MATSESIPPDLFLSGYQPDIRDIAECLRRMVHEAVPEAVERVRTGWRLIGYDVPVGRRTRYFAFVAPEPEHVHLGFEYGVWMTDPDGLLLGAHLDLRNVRFVADLTAGAALLLRWRTGQRCGCLRRLGPPACPHSPRAWH